MRRTLIVLFAAVLAACCFASVAHAGWTWDRHTCHGNNRACQAAPTTAVPAATITVTADTTVVHADGCQPNEFVSYHIEYDGDTTTTFNAGMYSNAAVDGSFDATLPVGANEASGFLGAPYTSAHLILTCGDLTLTADTVGVTVTAATAVPDGWTWDGPSLGDPLPVSLGSQVCTVCVPRL